ncbi:hypothetical protein ES707_16097 [subsurface metagenome]
MLRNAIATLSVSLTLAQKTKQFPSFDNSNAKLAEVCALVVPSGKVFANCLFFIIAGMKAPVLTLLFSSSVSTSLKLIRPLLPSQTKFPIILRVGSHCSPGGLSG